MEPLAPVTMTVRWYALLSIIVVSILILGPILYSQSRQDSDE